MTNLAYYLWELETCTNVYIDWSKWRLIMNYYFNNHPVIYKMFNWGIDDD